MTRGHVLILSLTLAACSRLVDLDGISGGKPQAPPDAGMHDAGDGDGADASPGLDAHTPDAKPDGPDAQPDSKTPEVDAGNGCPSREGLTRMVRVTAGTASFCVDEHEVTREQYRDFIESAPDLSELLSGGCSTVTDVKPANGYPPASQDLELPVVYVTYCGAEAYCAYADRALCGAIKGGTVRDDLASSPTYGALARACAGENGRNFAYGDTYGGNTCNGAQNGLGGPLPVGTLATCVTPDTGIHDLSGNVWEWIDACRDDGGGTGDSCYAQGGAYNSGETELGCTAAPHYAQRVATEPTVGIRCCAY